MAKVLIIDDEKQILSLLSRIIELEGYEVFQATTCKAGLKQLEQNNPEVILCDVCLPDGSGVELVCGLKKLRPLSEIILLTAHGNIPDGVQAIKNGAFDYITKGDDNQKILPLIAKAMDKASAAYRQNKVASSPVGKQYSFDTIIGKSPAILEAVDLARKVSRTDVPVLLTGETGTGKEVFAQSIHQHSSRSEKAFVAVNCSSFSRDLLESEMFGHKAGAFTGALKETKGLFEEADNGTIFLDEIGEMAFDLQAKLLRILETGEFIKIGDTRPIKVNVRVIAATNRDLSKEIAEGNFREDLFYRLSVFQIHLPSLRERTEDIPLHVKAFVDTLSVKMGKEIQTISPDYVNLLKRYPWKGNVRELRNVIERSLIIADGNTLDSDSLPLNLQQLDANSQDSYSGFDLSGVEKMHIQKVLKYTNGNKTETSRLLGIGLTTLYRKIEEYGL
ncbi:sigma-54-dependent transcriptional regulator [Parabacteroides bouchesdurhonensis]|uniref:sigma-54-dependent transcriptional regulator n=1 Tax=Parabacteroides bouchesdurhonensis TaxID=1936995 RepID=UPI000E4E4F8A|nr:sigma-54 dependent transcriptional regulator [Parabacteroides bouchesdurhonensis]RHJ91035.1 sigma-54-dependent Fis family transcriptional regulator [Bacteroides sp. AM07-16]